MSGGQYILKISKLIKDKLDLSNYEKKVLPQKCPKIILQGLRGAQHDSVISIAGS